MSYQEIKLILLGQAGIGKRSLEIRYCQGVFYDRAYFDCMQDTYRKHFEHDGEQFIMELLESHYPHPDFPAMLELYVRNAQVFLLMYSIRNRESFQLLGEMVEFIQRVKDTDRIQAVVVGTCSDMECARQVSTKEGSEFAERLALPFLELSSKEYDPATFYTLQQCIVDQFQITMRDRFSHDKKVHVIPRKAEKPFLSTMRQDFARFVNAPDYADILITSSSYEQFQLIYLLGRDNNQSQFWMPRDVWLLILSAGAEIGLFNDYFKFNLHRTIVFCRFPALMELIHPTTHALILPMQSFRIATSMAEKSHARNWRDQRGRVNPPFLFETQCELTTVLTTALRLICSWLYSGHFNASELGYQDRRSCHVGNYLSKLFKIYPLVACLTEILDQQYVNSPPSPQNRLDSFALLFNEPPLHDVVITLKSSGQTVKMFGHKAILAARSIFFQTAMANTNELLIETSSVELSQFVIRYLYTDLLTRADGNTTPFTIEELKEIIMIATQFKVPSMSDWAQNEICKLVTYENSVPLYVWVKSLNFKPIYLNSYLEHWIGHRVKIMSKTDEWKLLDKNTLALVEPLQYSGKWKEDKDNCIVS